MLSRLVEAQGIKVVLSAEGSDETFYGISKLHGAVSK